jgi:hypothetical protein
VEDVEKSVVALHEEVKGLHQDIDRWINAKDSRLETRDIKWDEATKAAVRPL